MLTLFIDRHGGTTLRDLAVLEDFLMVSRFLPPIAAFWPPQVEEVTYQRHGRTAVLYVEVSSVARLI